MSLEVLAKKLLDAKRVENAARESRILIEEEIISVMGSKLEGVTKEETDNYIIINTGRINRKVDFPGLINSGIKPELLPVKQEPKLDTKGLKWLEENDSQTYKNVCLYIEAKPGKTSVVVKRKDK